jgi:hypothetical protein
MMPLAAELSVVTGVAGCRKPILDNVVRTILPSLVLTKSAPASASVAEEAMCLRMPVGLSTAPLGMSGLLGRFPRKKWPPAQLRALVSLR